MCRSRDLFYMVRRGHIGLDHRGTRRDIGRLVRCLTEMGIARLFIRLSSSSKWPKHLLGSRKYLRLYVRSWWLGSNYKSPRLLSTSRATPRVHSTQSLRALRDSPWSRTSPSLPPKQLDGSASIGRPIANVQTYVLDTHLQPVPIGVLGELYIGGDGLSRGYLNRPELTAEQFVPHPFSDKPGARLYKSGDLARYLPDGNLECLGRIDHQVKIRGFRIEPGETEGVLEQHPAVQKCVVVAGRIAPGTGDL